MRRISRLMVPLTALAVGTLLAFAPAAHAAVTFDLTKAFGTASSDRPYGITTRDGDIYTTGYTTGTFPGQANQGGQDIYLSRHDSVGNGLWTVQFGTAGTDYGWDLSSRSDQLYLAASTTGTLGTASAGGRDAVLMKINPLTGASVWTRQFGSSSQDEGRAVVATDEGVYIAGDVGEDFGGDPGSQGNAFLRKYSHDGDLLWTRVIQTPGLDSAWAVAHRGGVIYVAGSVAGKLGKTHAGNSDGFIRAYSTTGKVVWTSQFGSAALDEVRDMAVNKQVIAVSGYTQGALFGPSAGSNDAFVRAYSTATRKPRYGHMIGTAGNDAANGVTLRKATAYVGGDTSGTFSGEVSAGGDDLFIAEARPDGIVDIVQFGTANNDSATDMGANRTFVAGIQNTFPGQPFAGVIDVLLRRIA